jgi:hypothetical protein
MEWRIADIWNYRVFLWVGWKIQWWTGFEYWDRLCLGCVYVLYFRDIDETGERI